MRKRILSLRSERYKHLVDILLLVSLGQFILLIFVFRGIFPEKSFLFDTIIRISAMLMFFLQGCAGFVIMIRKEFRQIIKIRGRAAQVIGFILWMIGWFIVLYIFEYTLHISTN